MMAWEADIMKRTADLLLPKPGLRVLNVGHGLGIIDTYFQSHSPISHHIIEAHPAVLDKLRKGGWHEKPGVVIHEGRWQDVLPRLIQENVMLDAIYFDTFAEDYKALREFFSEYVIGLLDPQGGEDGNGGRWGFFNGMGADRRICYDVYTKVRAHYNQPILKWRLILCCR
jgi:type IV protein arginine methyltransferase